MTHRIGIDTCNLSVNVPKDVRSVLGRAAFAAGKTMGEFLKQVIPAGLETVDPAAAAKVREIHQQYYGMAMLAVFICALACGDELELRRARARTRVEERVEETAI